MKTIRELPKRFFSSCILKSGLSFAPKLSPLPPKTPLAAAIRFQCYRPYKTTLVQNRTARMYDRPPGLSPRVSYNQSQLPRSRQRAEPLRRHLPELVGEARPAILRIPCSIKHMRAIPGAATIGARRALIRISQVGPPCYASVTHSNGRSAANWQGPGCKSYAPVGSTRAAPPPDRAPWST